MPIMKLPNGTTISVNPNNIESWWNSHPEATPVSDPFGHCKGFAAKRGSKEMIIDAMEGFTFGCDPELFVKNTEGVYVSAQGLIPGTKYEPHKVEGGAVQVDGMAAEFNIDPVSTFREFNSNIEKVMKQLEGFLPKGFTLEAVPMVRFDKEVWDAAPDIAKELGCHPDCNAWTGEVNPPPEPPEDDPYMRTASGHLHIGWGDSFELDDVQHIINCQDLVKQLDWYAGAWSAKMDTDPTRRKLYGRAGACRYKPYGVEYRVLSNFWVTTRDRRLAVWNRMQEAIKSIQHNFLPERYGPDWNNLVINSINETKLNKNLVNNFKYPITSIDRMQVRF